MAIDLPVVVLIALAALFVGASASRRAAEHADRVAGRHPISGAARRGPLGALADLVDQSVAAYSVRQRLGLSTATRSERRADAARAALVARADEIRRMRTGAAPAIAPAHLVVAGRAGRPEGTDEPATLPPPRRSATLPVELIAAAVGLVLVVGLVVAITPRSEGAVLSATGVPASTGPVIPTPTLSPTPSLEPVAS